MSDDATAGGQGPGAKDERASDLRDNRQGAYDPVGNQKLPNTSQTTPTDVHGISNSQVQLRLVAGCGNEQMPVPTARQRLDLFHAGFSIRIVRVDEEPDGGSVWNDLSEQFQPLHQ